MRVGLNRLAVACLMALPIQAFAQADASVREEASLEAVGESQPAARPERLLAKAKNAKPGKSDPVKLRLAEISRVHKSEMEFGAQEFEAWKAFWTKIRDDRGLFEVRLSAERKAFVESLGSLDAQYHSQSLFDFETMQTNKMQSFEASQSAEIKEFIEQRQSKLKEFGLSEEAGRKRLSEISRDAWVDQRTGLGIAILAPDEKFKELDKEGKKKKSKKKKKEKSKDDSKD